MTGRAPKAGWPGIVVAGALLLALVPSVAAADSVAVRAAQFVVPRWDTAAVAIGGVAYVYQGYTPPSETAGAFSYAPASDTLTQLAAVYPGSRQGASAATDGTSAWTFGGEVLSDYKKEIIKHDLAGQGSFTTLPVQFASGRSWSAAAWAGSAAYVFGGQLADGMLLDEIVRFDPGAGTATVVGHLPHGLMGASAVSTGSVLYLFGGFSTNGYSDNILRFDPSSGAVTIESARLPTKRDGMGAAWDGGSYVYLFGGCEANACNLKQVVRYDLDRDRVKAMGAELPSGRGRTSAVWIGGYAYVFGGQQGPDVALNQVLRYTPNPPNAAPVAAFEVSVAGLRIDLDAAKSGDAEGALALYDWDWGDGSPKGSGLTATHTYASAGTKTVRLTVEDLDGANASVTAAITLTTGTQSSGTGGPVVIWYPSAPGASSSQAPATNASKGPVGSPSPLPSVPRVDPITPAGGSPSAGLAVLMLGIVAAGLVARRRA